MDAKLRIHPGVGPDREVPAGPAVGLGDDCDLDLGHLSGLNWVVLAALSQLMRLYLLLPRFCVFRPVG